jgi:hypothetical protein
MQDERFVEQVQWVCVPQIKPENIGDAVHPGSDVTECVPLAARDIGASLFNDK